MAKSRYEYVKDFERDEALLPNTFVVIRVDGRGFHRFTETHGYEKPNDRRGIALMNAAARAVFREVSDIVFGFGVSDEYSFVLPRSSTLYGRRSAKIQSTVVSCFAAAFVMAWPDHFPGTPLALVPVFDCRAVLYPSLQTLRDYVSWRQADVHINNLYNTAFASLVASGVSPRDAETRLNGTVSADKNELLFSQFGIAYGTLPSVYRKGSILFKGFVRKDDDGAQLDATDEWAPAEVVPELPPLAELEAMSRGNRKRALAKATSGLRKAVLLVHTDVIGDAFWDARPTIVLDP